MYIHLQVEFQVGILTEIIENKWDDTWKTWTNSTQWLTWEKYMYMDSSTNKCTFWSTGQYYDSTYLIWRNCDGKWTGNCLGQSLWFVCDSSKIFDLETMTCISAWGPGKVSIISSQYTIGSIWREPNFYIDPYSSQLVELGTKSYPFKTLRAVFSDLLNNFSHKDLNITVNVKESTIVYLTDSTNYIMNITSVKIMSYSDTSNSPGRATLIPTLINLPTTNSQTSFHILKNMELNLDQKITAGTFTSNEIQMIKLNPSTFIVARSNFYLYNINFNREPVDNYITSFFVFLVYLQDKWFDVRNVNFNITGYAFRTYDPLNIYMENLFIDTRALRGFSSFKATWNYPEASMKGEMFVSNITVVTTSDRPFQEDPSIIYYLGPANMTSINIDLSGYYARDPSVECGIWAISSAEWVPNDGVPHIFQFSNTTLQLSDNSIGSKYSSIFIVQDQNIYRTINAYIDKVYSPLFETPVNPIIAAFGTTNAILYITNSVFINTKLKQNLMLIVLFQQVISSNITFTNSAQIGSSIIRSEYAIAFVASYIQFVNLSVTTTNSPFILLSNFDFTYTVVNNINIQNCTLSGSQIIQNTAPLNQIIIASGYYEGLNLTNPTALYSTGTIQSVILQNHTFIKVFWGSTDTSSTILSIDSINLNSELDSMISDIFLTSSEISIVKFGSLVNSTSSIRNILFQNIQATSTTFSTSRNLIDTSSVISTENIAITFLNLAFNNLNFLIKGNILLFKHQLKNPVVVANSTFTNLVSALITIDSYGNKNTTLNTKTQFSNWNFNFINSKYNSLLNVQNNAIVEVSYSNFTNISTYEEAAVLYAGFEKTSTSFSMWLFLNNSAVEGTIFVIESESVVKWANCSFAQNFGITGTIFKTATNGYFQFTDSNISGNYAINNPVGELLDGAILWVISNSTINYNQVMSIDAIKSEFNSKWYHLWFVPQDFIQYVNKNNLLVPNKFDTSLVQLILSSLTIDIVQL